MAIRRAAAAFVARGAQSWEILLQRDVTAPPQAPSWLLPSVEFSEGTTGEHAVAKGLGRFVGTRIVGTEMCPLGSYSLSEASGRPQFYSASMTILPAVTESARQLEAELYWWPLQTAARDDHSPTLQELHRHMVRDAARVAPADELSGPVITSMKPRHGPSLRTLVHSARERTGGVTPRVWERDLAQSEADQRTAGGDLLVAALNDFVVGTCGLRPVTRTCAEINWMLVHPRWRFKGLGTRLLAQTELRAAELGFTSLVVDSLHLHGPGNELFGRAGFERGAAGETGTAFAATKKITAAALV